MRDKSLFQSMMKGWMDAHTQVPKAFNNLMPMTFSWWWEIIKSVCVFECACSSRFFMLQMAHKQTPHSYIKYRLDMAVKIHKIIILILLDFDK